MAKKTSFSYNINRLIGIVFGIVFLIVFFASAILLYLAEDSLPAYYWKVSGTFLIYLVLYVFSVYYISKKISRMFDPLDQIAMAIAKDRIKIYGETADLEIFAEQLSERMEKMADISDELSVTRDNLNDIWQESEENRSRLSSYMKRCRGILKHLEKNLGQLEEQTASALETIGEGGGMTTKLKLSGKSMNDDSEAIRESLRECNRFQQDRKADKKRQNDTFEVLNGMQKESIDLIETIYSELAYIQDLATKLDLYATNVSLDYARSGSGSLTISAALDEIKETDRRMRDKVDDLTMLLIRTKNAVQLANDQTDFCIELNMEEQKIADQTEEKLSFISMRLQGLMEISAEISDVATRLLNHYYELPEMMGQQNEALKLTIEETEKLDRCLEEMEQMMAQKKNEETGG